jgi:hypothetical protein
MILLPRLLDPALESTVDPELFLQVGIMQLHGRNAQIEEMTPAS